MFVRHSLIALSFCLFSFAAIAADKAPQQLLLLSQKPDGHPAATHEYEPGQKVLAKLLRDVPQLEISLVRADGDWTDGPAIIDKADHCVLFVSEGAKWVNNDPARRHAFRRMAERKGGLSVFHWGMGTREAAHIDTFVQLFGACHGGPDRKYKFLETTVTPAADHPATAGLTKPFTIKEEFYYALKRDPGNKDLIPLLTARIDDNDEMVSWAWTRPDGGRSFGFSGLHYHNNWQRPEYQSFLAQGVLWTTQLPQPKSFPATLAVEDLELGK
ncbi:Trehalose utilization [Anatilimnocola aggregata]|uniref:Trehalose utilization n=1 Tax=Anatilimnocola aggregata TaxID=2528021 RepID=A0A517Y8E9_9BACT|nr:ThuA domain-containing protein [Anatilimnocola aggregata]QDU26510.1 Trehalose utilization [Anatilimnocola aggregata]